MVVPALLATVATMLPATAQAQDYTSGSLVGTVKDASGHPVGGATVTAVSLAQGVSRTTVTDTSGAFRFNLIPIGGYSVTVTADGFNTTTDDHVNVVLGSESGFEFTLEPSTQVVVVKAKARPKLDFAQTTIGTVVDVEGFSKQMPIARNVTALTLLAPSAVPGDGAFGAGATAQGLTQPSVSGASVGENIFYVNGLNITNFVNGIGAAGVPFDFYKTIEVKTGGYQAEYGRGTGGVINAVTKSGGNTWAFALHGNFQPKSLRSQSPDTFTNNIQGAVGHRTTQESNDYTFEASGPLIADKLFVYALYQAPEFFSTTATTQGNTYQETRYNDPVWALKLDGYLTSKHHFELTAFDTTRELEQTQFDYGAPAYPQYGQAGGNPSTHCPADTICDYKLTGYQRFGGPSWVGRYTGTLTNWLTISAAYGDSKFDQATTDNLPLEPLVRDQRAGSTVTISRQPTPGAATSPSMAERKFYRADADFYFNLLGKHHVRMGLDHEDTIFNNISFRYGAPGPLGGQDWTYKKVTSAATAASTGLALGQEYVSLRTFNGGGIFNGVNEAQYIQDSWDIGSRLNLNIGYRNDDFTENDADGQAFSVLKGNKAWRLGFSFDPTGEKKDKIFGFYGRYFLPVAANTAYRAASNNLDVTQNFLPVGGGLTFGALDQQGKPVAGLGAVLIRGVNSNIGALGQCKQLYLDRGIIPVPVNQLSCQVGSAGVAPAPEAVSALNVKATAEDEYILGYERRINPLWKVGVTATYRKLLTAADDLAIDAAVNAYCDANHIAGCSSIWSGTAQYLISNPGEDVVAVLFSPLPGQTDIKTLTLKAADLGFPKAQREYKSLEFTWSRAFDGKWGLNGSLVLSQSKGNFEGAVKSDTGQADAGITSDFDIVGFTDGAYGLLPNHHGYQLKMWGSYAVNDNFLVGFNYSGISGRHYGCNGIVPPSRDPGRISTFYSRPAAHYCGGILKPRGESFVSDFINRLDVSARYTVPSQYMTLINNSNLVLRADIFNLFDLKGVQEAVETGETPGGQVNLTYRQPVTYQTPRFVRLGFDLSF